MCCEWELLEWPRIRSSFVGWLWVNASCVGLWWRVWVHYGVHRLQSRVLVGNGVNGLLSSLSCPLSSHLSPLLSCSPPSSPFPSLPLTLPLILSILYAVDEGLHGQNVLQSVAIDGLILLHTYMLIKIYSSSSSLPPLPSPSTDTKPPFGNTRLQ